MNSRIALWLLATAETLFFAATRACADSSFFLMLMLRFVNGGPFLKFWNCDLQFHGWNQFIYFIKQLQRMVGLAFRSFGDLKCVTYSE